MPTIELPKAVSPASRVDPKMLILYGQPKVGKTTALADLPDNLIIDLERGTDFISALKLQANDYNELTQIWLKLNEQKKLTGKPAYRYITLDSATKLEDWAEEVATAEYRKLTIAKTWEGNTVLDLPNGAGYGYIRKVFMRIVNKFREVSDHVILVAHVRMSQIDKEGDKASSRDLDLTGKLKTIASADADAIGYLYRDIAGRLMVSFQSTDANSSMGSRSTHLVGQNIPLEWKRIFLDDTNL